MVGFTRLMSKDLKFITESKAPIKTKVGIKKYGKTKLARLKPSVTICERLRLNADRKRCLNNTLTPILIPTPKK